MIKQIISNPKPILLALVMLLSSVGYSQGELEKEAKKFEDFLKGLENRYVDSVDLHHLVEVAIRSALDELDPHSVYLDEEQLSKANEPLRGKFNGIGIQYQIVADTLTVMSTTAGGPSEKAGIVSADQLIAVNDKEVAGQDMRASEITDLLKGERGSAVKLTIRRMGFSDLLNFNVQRDRISIESVETYFMVENRVGYIKLNRFSSTTVNEMKEAFSELKKSGMRNLILDLRGNSGGYLSVAQKLTDEFLEDRKLMVYTQGMHQPKREVFANSGGEFITGKLAILIDEGSASASEILAGAIQDWDRGIIVGRRSYGKGLVQKPLNFSDGSAIRLTVSRYYTPTGRSIQRSYAQGKDAYRKEIRERASSGELYSADSLDLPDSVIFFTPANRKVYGGGGIIPDIFVPADTSEVSEYYSQLRKLRLINGYAVRYAARNKSVLAEQYPSAAKYRSKFEVSESMMGEFRSYASSRALDPLPDEWERSQGLIARQIKVLIARNIWDYDGFYEANVPNDKTLQAALRAFDDSTFEELGLKYD